MKSLPLMLVAGGAAVLALTMQKKKSKKTSPSTTTTTNGADSKPTKSKKWSCESAVKALIGSSGSFVPSMNLRSELKALAPSKFSITPINLAAEQLAIAALNKMYPGCNYPQGFALLNANGEIDAKSASVLSGVRTYASRELIDAGYGEGWACPEAVNDLINPAGIFSLTDELEAALIKFTPFSMNITPIDDAATTLAIAALTEVYPSCNWTDGYNDMIQDAAVEPRSESVLISVRDYAMRVLLDSGYNV